MKHRSEQPDSLSINLFDYHLPPELIAQEPLQDREGSRLMVLDRCSKTITHSQFREIGNWFRSGDLLVLNDTKVLRARLFAQRETGGRIEFLLVEALDDSRWRSMARPARRLKVGETLKLVDIKGRVVDDSLTVLEKENDGYVIVDAPTFMARQELLGRVPLPHYIRGDLQDPNRYQTVYAVNQGSVAAPTAGLHFTSETLESIGSRGVSIAYVTLHVGPGTFQPVKTDNALEHKMHSEQYHVSTETLEALRSTRESGGRVVAVGTTSCRTLESIAEQLDSKVDLRGRTDLYITPGYQFSVVDGLITNFHLPKSTLLLLVSALAGRESVLRAYEEAADRKYRFYSFGDAMLII